MITFKQEHMSWTNDLESEITYKIAEDVSLNEVLQHFRKFLLAAGYGPDAVDKYIEAE